VSPESGKARAVIHFGMDKTGSSSIRASLSKHLDDPRFHYVILGGINNASRSLAAGFKEKPEDFPYFSNSGLSAEALQERRAEALRDLSAELQKAAGRTAIVSAEAVANFKESELRGLCDFIGRRGGSMTAVGYVRRPKEYMESNLQQQIKANWQNKIVPSSLLSDYRRRFEKFDAVLGRDNVQLWLFEPGSFPGGCVVRDFCGRVGIAFRPADVVRRNDGLSLPALSLLFAYRKFGPARNPSATLVKENMLLVRRLGKLPGPKLRLHSTVVAPVIEQRRAGLAWLEARMGASLAEDLGADDEHAIRTEADLLRFSPESLRWLGRQLGAGYAKHWHPRMTPQDVAAWMGVLQRRLASRVRSAHRASPAGGTRAGVRAST